MTCSDGESMGLIDDEISQVRFVLLADRRFERDRLLRDTHHAADLLNRKLHVFGQLFSGRLPAEFLHQRARCADQLVDGLDHVHGNAYGAGLIRDGARDGLPDPPGRIGRKLVAAAVFEFSTAFINPMLPS